MANKSEPAPVAIVSPKTGIAKSVNVNAKRSEAAKPRNVFIFLLV